VTPAIGENLTLAFLGRGSVGAVFLAFGLGAMVLAILLRRASWFLAAVAIPGAAAGLVGTTVWATEDISLRWLLIVGPVATGAIFASRREGRTQTAAAVVTAAAVAATFFFVGGIAAFLHGYKG